MQDNASEPTLYEGGCHCGRVRIRVRTRVRHISECNCSICTKKGYLHLVVSKDELEILSGQEELTEYRFNTGVARHLFCRTCGIHAFYVPRSDPNGYSVNARCLEGIDLNSFSRRSFDGLHWEEAIVAHRAARA